MSKWLMSLLICLTAFTAVSFSQTDYNFYLSNTGSDTNPGISGRLPRQTIRGSATLLRSFATSNGSVKVGLKSNSLFREMLSANYTLSAGVYTDSGRVNFSILDGGDVFNTGWQLLSGKQYTYLQPVGRTGFSVADVMGTGSYIYVTEVKTATRELLPFSSRRPLKLVSSIEEVENTPGSFFVPKTANNPLPVYVHTQNSQSPNNNPDFSYEVTTRGNAINAYPSNNNIFQNLWVRGYGATYGLLPSGSNSLYRKVVFGPGAPGHHVVTKNGLFDKCLFLPGPKNTNAFAIVFYDVQGQHRHNKISNSLFLDIKTPVYTHKSNGTNYNTLEINNVISFADTTENGGFLGVADTDTLLINNLYIDNHSSVVGTGSSNYVQITNAYLKDVGSAIQLGNQPGVKAVVSNSFIQLQKNIACVSLGVNSTLSLSNSILKISRHNNFLSERGGYFVDKNAQENNQVTATNNIFIVDIPANKYVISAFANTNKGIGTGQDRWKNNVYILLQGNIYWGVTNRSTNGGLPSTDFTGWQRQSGQDQNSLFFDLRKDPRGLKAIFLDPDNGNYQLANTSEGNQIRALGAGMTNPIPCFLNKPTYEEAAEIIRSDSNYSPASCRNPCQQAGIRLRSSALPLTGTQAKACVNSEVTFRAAGNYTQNDHYYHQSDNSARFLWSFSDGFDTSGTSLTALSHVFTREGRTDVRVQLVDANGCDFDTGFTVMVNKLPAKPDLGADTSVCHGGQLALQIKNPQPNATYSWNLSGSSTNGQINVTQPGEFIVRATNPEGCSRNDTVNVTRSHPVSVLLPGDTLFCASAPLLVKPHITGAVQSFKWNSGETVDTLRIKQPGTYVLQVEDGASCMAADTIVVTDNPVNHFEFTADTTICEGATYTLTLHPPTGTSISWNDLYQGPSRTLGGGSYQVTAVNAGCTIKNNLFVHIQPLARVHLGPDTSVCRGFELPLSGYFPGALYRWSTGSAESKIRVHTKGQYWLQTSLNACTFSDTINVDVLNCACNFQLSNAFSPNRDGVNDVIKPTISCFPRNYTWRIFNRYGQEVFYTTNYPDHWDGTQNGKLLAAGTYYYVLSFSNEALQPGKPFTGSITLLR